MDPRKVELSGRVSFGTLDAGSKSERGAVTLTTQDGTTYELRKEGAPAFGDQSLDPLVGGDVTVSGIAIGNLLMVRDWRKLD
ncbi:conserved hypothetical protein [Hyphomicrobiales bacterium]|nr:conserved hypothetical protein [Hyphomicrobiales bacterium]CAH1701554.1 conserved hypothetical protein [Hyphomicrobiales bacterium]CAI0345729.1 conserved hypothetical protein [Hyphomicrobiales bacterium]